MAGIRIIHGFDPLSESEVKAMYREATETGCGIVTRELSRSDKIVGVQLDYLCEETRLELTILTTTKSRIHVPDVERHIVETMQVGNHPGVYLEDSSSQQLVWIESERDNIQYELRPATKVAKESLLRMAESMKQSG
ncbi:MAG: hypothetical protein K0R28_3005 [Paenibacillus sp.]|nr:hypothetical protein [Paenibacillus sp.]